MKASDREGVKTWASAVDDLDAAIMAANSAALKTLWRGASYVGTSLEDDPAEPVTRWLDADLAGTSWLHHLSAAGNPHLHIHNQIATIARTRQDDRWRQVDAPSLVQAAPALAAVASLHLESAMTQRFGVRWVQRADGEGWEIEGISQEVMDALSP